MSNMQKDKFHRFTPEEINKLPGREVKEKRTRSSKTYALGNGLYQAVIYPEAVHYRNDKGEWEDIDHTLKSENNCCCDHSGDLSVQLAPGGKVALRKNNHTLSWQIVGASEVQAQTANEHAAFPRHGKEQCVENVATYTDIFPNVDFVCELKPNQFKDTLIFKNAEALRPVEFLIHAENLTLHQAASGAVIAMCGDETIFRLPAPCVVNEDKEIIPGSAHAVLTRLGEADWHWVCEVDTEYAATTAYPIHLDPLVETEQTATAMSMAYTASKKPTTNYPATSSSTKIANNDTSLGKVCTFLRFEQDSLPEIDSSYYVTAATLTMITTSDCTSTAVYLREVLGDWEQDTINYNNQPAVSAEPLEYYMVPTTSGNSLNFNIANLVRKWYNDENHGVRLETTAGNLVKLGAAGSVYYKPYVTINYVSLAGLESYLVQDSFDCGRAGTAYVGLFNGNVAFAHQETAMNGNLLPISIGRFYNSCYRNVNPFGAGMGWMLSTQKSLHKETIDSTTYYVYMDADGTRHHFKKTSGVWNDLSGMQLTLTLGTDTATITDKGDNKMVFELPTVEFADNYANVGMLQSVTDAIGNTATFTHDSNRLLLQATDAAGRTTYVTTLNGMIRSIQAPGMPAVSYSYDTNNRLSAIIHEDGKTTSYSYNTSGLLTTITNHDGMSTTLVYQSKEPYRVSEVQFRNAAQTLYGGRRYTYGDCCTTVTELYPSASGTLVEGKALHYHFNDAGNLVSVNDDIGYGCFAEYDSSPTNHPDFVSKMQRSVSNYLKNHHFINVNEDWTVDKMDGSGDCAYNSEYNYVGGRAYRLNKTSSTGRISIYQAVTLQKGKSYTLSSQYRTASNAAAQLRLEWLDSTGTTCYVENDAMASTDRWERMSVSFTLPENAASDSVTVRLMAAGGIGKVWVDAVQLEDGLIPNRYNLLENGTFHMNTSGRPLYWTAGTDNTDDDGVTTDVIAGRPSDLTGNAVRLLGARGDEKFYSQTVPSIGHKGDTFVAGGWSYSHCRPRNNSASCYYEMQVLARPKSDSGTASFKTKARVRWSEEWSGWQFAAVPVVMDEDYTELKVVLLYQNNLNEAQFSNLFLHKEEFGQTYTYDDNANVTNVKNMAALQSDATYDDYNNMTAYLQPGRTESSEKFTLNWGDTTAKKKQHLLRKTTSPLDIVQRTIYDVDDSSVASPKGLPIENVLEDTSASKQIVSKTEYTSDKNYVSKQIDARGNAVTTVTDSNRGLVTSVTDPKGQQVTYTYDTLGRVTAVQTYTVDSDSVVHSYRNEYTYTDDKLTKVAHNTTGSTCDVEYTFGYDDQNRRTTVTVGGRQLSKNVYNTTKGDPLYGTLTRSEFGNGDQVRNTYDEFKRVIGVQFDNDTTDRYSYEYGADGRVARVKDHVLNRETLSEQDRSSRPKRITHTENGNHLYTGEVTYDDYSNLESFREQVGTARTAYQTNFTYNVENKPTKLTYGSTSDQVSYTYDSIGRISGRTVKVNGTSFPTTYSFVAGGHGTKSTTNLIQNISQTGGNFTYTYDANGNITQVIQDGVVTAYTYDALGQLIRVDDGHENATWVYAYDHGGNITSKRKYALGSNSGTLLESKYFTYGNSSWKDLLTSVDGTTISYDMIGNPIYDGTWFYTWEKGRQLAQMYKSGETVSFKYNADGLRVQKVATSTGTTNYTLHGKNIVHMTQGSNSLHFFYDANNKPAIVEYNGVKYAYVHNLQGDIVAILDSTGTAVVQYKYDAWGKPISKTGSMASTLGTVQPFRYRGYVYDEETALYYLRSRYYSPVCVRFISADLLVEGNLYAYCVNNPILLVDKNGFFFSTKLKLGLIAGAIGAVIGGVGQVVRNLWAGKRGTDAFDGFAGAIVGGFVYNFLSVMTNPTTAAYASAFAESATNELLSYWTEDDKEFSLENISDSFWIMIEDTVVNGTLYYITGDIASRDYPVKMPSEARLSQMISKGEYWLFEYQTFLQTGYQTAKNYSYIMEITTKDQHLMLVFADTVENELLGE